MLSFAGAADAAEVPLPLASPYVSNYPSIACRREARDDLRRGGGAAGKRAGGWGRGKRNVMQVPAAFSGKF